MPATKSAMSIGLFIYAPISLSKSTRDIKISFNQLCKKTGERIRQKKYCPSCNKEVSDEDIVKGYEFEKGRYVTFTADELERLKTKGDKAIRIDHFSKMSEIDSIYYNRDYYVTSDPGTEKTFELLRQAMLSEKLVAVGKVVLNTKEEQVILYPTKETIIAKILYSEEEIQPIPKSTKKVDISKEELNMAKTMIKSLYQKFDISAFVDTYTEKIRDAIEQKIEGKEIVTPTDNPVPNNVIDIMTAMQKITEMATGHKGTA